MSQQQIQEKDLTLSVYGFVCIGTRTVVLKWLFGFFLLMEDRVAIWAVQVYT